MDRFIALLQQYPLIAFVLLAWLAGMIGNAVRAVKRARERAEQASRQRHGELPSQEQRSTRDAQAGDGAPARGAEPVRSADQIAREMRRILGVEEPEHGDVATAPPPQPPPLPHQGHAGRPRQDHEHAEHREREQQHAERRHRAERLRAERAAREQRAQAERQAARRREVPSQERAPTPVVPTTSSRRLAIHVDPHVGEAIQRRSSVQSGRVGGHAAGHELGGLGGRVGAVVHRERARGRYALDDLKRAIVLNEILGPPLALRGAARDV